MPSSACVLCENPAPAGSVLVARDGLGRVLRVTDQKGFPAYYRWVAAAHVAEFTDLLPDQRMACMQTVSVIERTLIEQLAPTKINLASFGNWVPHLHWHVIARFDWDSHFPESIWGPRQRDTADVAAMHRVESRMHEVDAAIAASIAQRKVATA